MILHSDGASKDNPEREAGAIIICDREGNLAEAFIEDFRCVASSKRN